METISVLQELFKVLFPKEIALNFEIKEVKEEKDRIILKLEELPELLPKSLQEDKEIVLDGFCNPIELQSFPLKGKPVFLNVYRRRWKRKGEDTHYSNTYNLHPEGVKATAEFAAFLKDAFGYTPDQYNSDISGIVR
jgi:hypothetical protein